jgi:tetratricopeptide (TPR) repeat protein
VRASRPLAALSSPGLLVALLCACGGPAATPAPRKPAPAPAKPKPQAPPQTLELDLPEVGIVGEAYSPKGRPESSWFPAPTVPPGRGGLPERRKAWTAATGKKRVLTAEQLAAKLAESARALGENDLYDEAEKVLREAVDLPDAGAATFGMLGAVLEARGDYQGAADMIEKVLTKFPTAPFMNEYEQQLTWLEFQVGPEGRAKMARATTKAADGGDPLALYFRGWQAIDEGRYDDAVNALTAALGAATTSKALSRRAIADDLLRALAWRGGEASDVIYEVLSLRGVDPKLDNLAGLATVGDYLAERGLRRPAARIFRQLLGDQAITTEQRLHAYELLARMALAGRHLDNLAEVLAEMLATAEAFPEAADRERAAKLAADAASQLDSEWSTAHERAAALAAQKIYAALQAHAKLSPAIDVSAAAKRLEQKLDPNEPQFPHGTAPNQALIQRIVGLVLPELRNCYERSLVRKPTLTGKLDPMVLEINPDGSAHVTSEKSVGLSKEDDFCVVAAAEAWRFPPHPPRLTVLVKLRVAFTSAK